ncbi:MULTISPECIES: GNAT family N-acetyltransferase [Pontibacter]|uniref:Acetyltransferase (GNAT) domain-containing protein n=1 Tax=Pontibacter lucknowensis TaxID=1077936 RepID=A0A1N6U4Q9_9BACT|nr:MULTISPECIES: GNAT family N-acetyltransferase [Pontibacter]EJF09518.1 acyltransferase [Pontibacter sp. BAB1700]SIQ60560.1 Acetyltransferase (GNAT) domain-containing protein [Pontibacter lucknowensis]
MQVIEPATPEQFKQYYQLRYDTLRKPWDQPKGSERAEDDEQAIHAMLVDDAGEAVGVCRLHLNTPQEGQIRFMGVRGDKQGQRLGDLLISYLEDRARQFGATSMTLQARENAVNFYRRNGYEIVEKTYLLFGSIQHYKMAKQL